jgi:hypothetical protein
MKEVENSNYKPANVAVVVVVVAAAAAAAAAVAAAVVRVEPMNLPVVRLCVEYISFLLLPLSTFYR